jgi:hypothetical protein
MDAFGGPWWPTGCDPSYPAVTTLTRFGHRFQSLPVSVMVTVGHFALDTLPRVMEKSGACARAAGARRGGGWGLPCPSIGAGLLFPRGRGWARFARPRGWGCGWVWYAGFAVGEGARAVAFDARTRSPEAQRR